MSLASMLLRTLVATSSLWTTVLAAEGAKHGIIHNFASEDILDGDDGLPPNELVPLSYGKPVVHVSTEGNMVEEHNGQIAYLDGRYYMYSDAWACGKLSYFPTVLPGYDAPTTYPDGDYGGLCGHVVHSSADLTTWRYETRFELAGMNASQKPQCAWNAARGKYVLTYTSGAASNLDFTGGVFFSEGDTPLGPWSDPTVIEGDHLSHDYDIVVDNDTDTSYIVTDVFSGDYDEATGAPLWDLYIQQLKPDFSGVVGNSTDANATHLILPAADFEAIGAVYVNGSFYITGGPTCGNCAAAIQVTSAPALTGPWTPLANLSSDGCTGQNKGATLLPTADGTDAVLGAVWGYRTNPTSLHPNGSVVHGDNSQAISSTYWFPYEFGDDGALLPLTCAQTTEFPLADSSVAQPSSPPPYQPDCRVRNTSSLRQVFAPEASNKTTLRFPVFQKVDELGPYAIAGPDLNAPLDIRVEYQAGAVETHSFPASNVSWAPQLVDIPLNSKKALRSVQLSTTADNGCYGVLVEPSEGAGGWYGVLRGNATQAAPRAKMYVYQ
ncbi:glycosyl hydrolase [Xylariomycetidae sp. FL0641]|nr:glycosyl hydrolase [Xylariomycetidae sp. FL0641]